jgi:ABC-2 type transport system permease protein
MTAVAGSPLSAPRGVGPLRRVVAQAGMEVRLTLRNGESLLVAFAIPLGLLGFFSLVDVLPHEGSRPVDFLLPGVLALSVMSTAMVALGIATGFERHYLVLKRLGATPLRRGELIAAKIAAVVAVEVVQVAVLLGLGVGALGFRPSPGAALWLVPVALAVGTAAFAGLGLAMAGRLRAVGTLAAANALYLLLLLVGGIAFPLDVLPEPVAAAARVLPSAPLAGLLRAAFSGALETVGLDLAVLSAWAVGACLLAARVFRWQ